MSIFENHEYCLGKRALLSLVRQDVDVLWPAARFAWRGFAHVTRALEANEVLVNSGSAQADSGDQLVQSRTRPILE